MVKTLLVLGHLSGLNIGVWGSNPGPGSTATFAVANGNVFSMLKYTNTSDFKGPEELYTMHKYRHINDVSKHIFI